MITLARSESFSTLKRNKGYYKQILQFPIYKKLIVTSALLQF